MAITLEAQRYASAASDTTAEMFRQQFALLPEPLADPSGFSHIAVGTHYLYTAPGLPVTELIASDGVQGVCLGIAVDQDGVCLSQTTQLPERIDLEAFWAGVEKFVIGLAGRYLLIVRRDTDVRIYGDLSSSMACVFDPETGYVASSTLMCLARPVDVNDVMPPEWATTGRQRYCFGHTHDRAVKRLSANHYLTLNGLEQTRFWPRDEDFNIYDGAAIPGAIAEMSDRLARVLAAIISAHASAMPLTGGWDSRILASCLRGQVSDVHEFYTVVKNFPTRIDSRVAERIAKTLGVSHRSYDLRKRTPDPAELEKREARYLAATGFEAISMAEATYGPDVSPAQHLLVIRGNVLEVLRAQHWKGRLRRASKNLPFSLKRCLITKGHHFEEFQPTWMPHFTAWADALPDGARDVLIDMGFIEHYLPNFGNISLGFAHNFFISPFNDRQLFKMSARLPIPYKTHKKANTDLILHNNPDLMEIPLALDVMDGTKPDIKL